MADRCDSPRAPQGESEQALEANDLGRPAAQPVALLGNVQLLVLLVDR